jgi:FkbM family methyltransferase
MNPNLKSYVRKILPSAVWQVMRYFLTGGRTELRLAWLRSKFLAKKPNSLVKCLKYTLRITTGPDFYIQFKDIFIRGIYHFDYRKPDPLIIDGGSNIGMSILYFKHLYPSAHIIGFEPDPATFRILQENMARNRFTDVKIINAGLASMAGTKTFQADGSVGSHLTSDNSGFNVRVERLSDRLNQPVDFLKLNIEGEELSVLQEAETSGRLRNICEMVLEYHGWINDEQRLGLILNLLDRQGYRYLVHDFDAETCLTSKPPFRLTSQSTWYCLVYARRED